MINLLRNVLDNHAFSLQTAQLTRERNYNDKTYKIHSCHLKKALEWTYRNQKTPVDTDFSEPDTVDDEAGENSSKNQQKDDDKVGENSSKN